MLKTIIMRIRGRRVSMAGIRERGCWWWEKRKKNYRFQKAFLKSFPKTDRHARGGIVQRDETAADTVSTVSAAAAAAAVRPPSRIVYETTEPRRRNRAAHCVRACVRAPPPATASITDPAVKGRGGPARVNGTPLTRARCSRRRRRRRFSDRFPVYYIQTARASFTLHNSSQP